MIKLAEIAIWLQGKRDYDKGKALFLKHRKQYNGSMLLEKLLNSPPTAFTKTLLRKELQKIYDKSSVQFTPVKRAKKIKYKPLDTTGWPDDLLRLKTQNIELIRKIEEHRGVIRSIVYEPKVKPNDHDHEKVKGLALQIHLWTQENEANWEKLRYYNEHGKRMPDSHITDNEFVNKMLKAADESSFTKEIILFVSRLERAITLKRNGSSNKDKLHAAQIDVATSRLLRKTVESKYGSST
ncbi:MAG: hypothetical protein ACRBFS_22835 [Aureispira sp.]